MPAQHWSTPMQSFGGVPMAPSTSSGGARDVILASTQQQQQGGGVGGGMQYLGGGGASNTVELSPVNAQGNAQDASLTSSLGGGGAQSTANLVYPALHLHPLNDSFVPKQISLAPAGPANRVKIGRQTNAKTIPHPSNGYFDSKVLSRMHAEVWSQEGKVFIKDVKSSNGTFINGERLSAEGVESDVFELHSEDMVEFGIDIVGEDNRTIIHHKVACRCYLVMTAEDALGIRSDFAALYRGGGHGGPMGGAAMGPGAEGGLRRGKSTMSFDHILSRLQSEIQKSRETTNELNGVQSAFAEVGETLNGGLPPMPQPPYQHMVPPHPAEAAAANAAATASAAQSANVAALQEQLATTQASLASHVDKIHALEGMLAEHETIKAEVGSMKAQMEAAKRDIDEMVARRGGGGGAANGTLSHANKQQHDEGEEEDFDDSASMASMDTVMADAGGANDAASATMRARSLPTVAAAAGDASKDAADALSNLKADQLATHEGPAAPPDEPPSAGAAALAAQNAQLTSRLEALEAQLEEALSLGRNLQAQHASATEAVRALEGRLATLESSIQSQASSAEAAAAEAGAAGAVKALEGRWSEWKETLETAWKKERSGWEEERLEMKRVVQAWDEANGRLEAEAERATNASLAGSSSDGANGVAAGAATQAGGRARRGSSKSAKRRAARRHLNPSLRALLYKPTHASGAGLLDDTSSSASDLEGDESDAEHAASRAARRATRKRATSQSGETTASADRSTDSSNATTTGSGSGESGASLNTPGTSPAGSVAGGFAERKQQLGNAGAQGAQKGIYIDPTSLPVLGAAGVVVVGIAAYLLMGKNGGAGSAKLS